MGFLQSPMALIRILKDKDQISTSLSVVSTKCQVVLQPKKKFLKKFQPHHSLKWSDYVNSSKRICTKEIRSTNQQMKLSF